MIPDDLASYLIDTYKPDAILLHGSRARKDNFPDSDYDFLLIGNFTQPVLPHRFENYSLDITCLSPETKNDFSHDVPTWPLEIVYDNDSRYGQAMMQANENLYKQGPQKLTIQQIENRKNFLRRLFVKMVNRYDAIQCRVRYAADIHQRALRYYFELSVRWNQPLPLALKTVGQEDLLLYQSLENLLIGDARAACASVFEILFKEKI